MDCDVVGPSGGLLLQAGQDRRVADRHPEPSHQPLRGPPARAMAKQPNNFRQSGGPARERRRKTWHALGEDAPITLLVSTPPAPQAGIHNDRRSLSGQIPERSPVRAVARFGLCAASRAGDWLPAVHRTVQACSPRSTLTTFKPAAGDHVIDVFISPCCRIPWQHASPRGRRTPRRLHQESIRPRLSAARQGSCRSSTNPTRAKRD